MVATPWVDCEGKLLLGSDGNPLFCEQDPCPPDGESDPYVDNYCARSFASDWADDELSPLAVTIGHNGGVFDKGIGFDYDGSGGPPDCSCDLIESTWVLPYDPTAIDRTGAGGTVVGHAWHELFIVPCEDARARLSYDVSAFVIGTEAGGCQLHVCTWAFIELADGTPIQNATFGSWKRERFIYNPPAGGPVDLTATVAVTLAGTGQYCAYVHPDWNGTSGPYPAGASGQYCNWNRSPAAWAVLT